MSLFLDKFFRRKITVQDDVRINQDKKKWQLKFVHHEYVTFLCVIPFFFGQIPLFHSPFSQAGFPTIPFVVQTLSMRKVAAYIFIYLAEL